MKLDNEIKFRGIELFENPAHGVIVWHYGGYVHQTDHYGKPCDKHFIIDGTETDDNDIGYAYRVEPETVQRYIGLKDDDGTEIFEGDYVQCGDEIFRVEFGRTVKEMYGTRWDDFFVGFFFDCISQKGYRTDPEYWMNSRPVKVIGNIYEPPASLKA